MKYIIIGLGNFGQVLAEELIAIDCEVIGVDNNPLHVELMKEKIPSVFQLDATDATALRILPLHDVDSVIVAIGESFGASVKAVALLKQLKVKHIQARAIDEIHESVLQGFGIARILKPERESSQAYVQSILSGRESVVNLKVDDKHSIIKLAIPEKFNQTTLGEFRLEELNLQLLKVCHSTETKNLLGFSGYKEVVLETFNNETTVYTNDTLVIFGANSDFLPLWKLFK